MKLTHKKNNLLAMALLPTLALTLTACGDSSGVPLQLSLSVPNTTNPMALSVSSALTVSSGNGELTVTDDSGNTLIISSAEIALREIEFERLNDDQCDAIDESTDDDAHDLCEKFELPGTILSIPLDGAIETLVSATIDADTYDEIEFDIHKLEDNDPILNSRPEFSNQSMRVEGTFNGSPFVYTNDLTEEQELELNPPLVVDAASPTVSVTFSVDVGSWFVDGDVLVDPATANDGGANESLVEDNIKASVEGFEDEDEDGEPDDD